MRILKLMVLMLLMAVGAQAQKTIQQNLSFRQEVGYLVTKYGATLYRNCGFPTNPDTLNARGKGFLAVDTCGFKFGIWNGTSWQEVSGAAAGDYLDSFNIAQPATYRLVFTYGKNGVLNRDTIDYVAGAGGGSTGIDTMSIRNDSLIYRKEGIFYFAGKVSNAVINGDTTIWEVVVDSTTLSSYYIPIAQPSGYFGKDTTLRWRPTTGALVVGANANIVQLEVNGRIATTGNVSVGGQLSIALVPIATDTTFFKPIVRHTITGEIRRLESWPSTGMTNPMTSAGDLIRGGTSGTPTRIAAGTDGYVLTMNTGIPTWMAASSGGVTTMAVIGGSPNSNGATISGSTLTLQPANENFGGVLTTGTQNIAGSKYFRNQLFINDGATNYGSLRGGGSYFEVESATSRELHLNRSNTAQVVIRGSNAFTSTGNTLAATSFNGKVGISSGSTLDVDNSGHGGGRFQVRSTGQTHVNDLGAAAPTMAAGTLFQLESTSRGFLPPRMTTTQMNAISSPVAGLMIYNSTENATMTFDGTRWVGFRWNGTNYQGYNSTDNTWTNLN